MWDAAPNMRGRPTFSSYVGNRRWYVRSWKDESVNKRVPMPRFQVRHSRGVVELLSF